MGNIIVTGFRVKSYGDHSVGEFDVTWTLTGEYEFFSKEDLENFREEIRQAYAIISGDLPEVLSYDEIDEQLRKEEELFKDPEHMIWWYGLSDSSTLDLICKYKLGKPINDEDVKEVYDKEVQNNLR